MAPSNDNFQFGKTQPLGKVSFGEETSYSDKFVRAPTADLTAPKKKSAPLGITADLVGQMQAQADNQLKTCRTILDKFEQRMRILKWAQEVASQAAGQPPAQTAAPQPPEPDPRKKGLFGKKAPPAPRPSKPAKPAKWDPASRPKTTVTLSSQEQAIAVVVARIVEAHPEVQRQVQIALYQYTEAVKAVDEALQGLSRARGSELQRAFDELEKLEVAKVQGKIYPLTNFHEVFKAHPQISRLFPPPMPRK